MINLRYHIVSITAVFLALGIGLAFGASFIEQATIGALEQNLNEIEQQNDDLEAANSELRRQLEVATGIDEDLTDQALGQLVAGELEEVPVLLLANAGVDDELVETTQSALVAAGAESPGVVRVTERFALDDQGEIDDLRSILGLPVADAEQLRGAVTRQVGSLFRELGGPPGSTGSVPEVVPVPPLLEQLISAGFLELDAAETPPSDFTLLPEAGLRVVGVSSTSTSVADEDFLSPMLQQMVSPNPTHPDEPPPVMVAAQPTHPVDADEEEEPPFVAPFRDDEVVRVRSSTVDDLDLFAGLVATVLAVAHGGDGQTGHYGLGEDAQSLVPLALVAPEDE
jgi:Copper transport outer membrane protein, MctB